MKARALLLLLCGAACGSSSPPTQTPPPIAHDAPVIPPEPVVAAAEIPATPRAEAPAPTSAPTACSIEEASCRCNLGNIESCIEDTISVSDDGIRVTMAFSLCELGEPVGCLMAASYLEKLHVAERFRTTPAALRMRAETDAREACAKNGGPCFRYGQAVIEGLYVTGRYKRPDRSGGLAMIVQACELGYGDACAALSDAHRTGTGRKRDLAQAKKLAIRACEANSAHGCELVADGLAPPRATELYTRACDGFEADACAKAGAAYRKASSFDAALASFLRGCDRGDHAQCAEAAAIIDAGQAANRDPVTARALFQEACDHSVPRGCAGLAAMTLAARGGERDWGHAIDLYAQACELKDRAACNRAREVAKAPPDGRCATVDECKRLCAERIATSCTEQARLVARTETDTLGGCAESRALYTKACDGGDLEACVLLGHAESDDAAEHAYGEACKRGLARSCDLQTYARHTDIVFLGASTKQQRARSRTALERACRQSPDACVWYAVALSRDSGGNGKEVLASACTRGSALACAVTAPDEHRCELSHPRWIRAYWK